jgi:hypothetical protein
MALKSSLFRSDSKLEACLVNDSAHVRVGARGDHVCKIQKALLALGSCEISQDEIVSKTYGKTTALAVLAYKKERNIVNYSYQSSADDIVGKMTIASLDSGMHLIDTSAVAERSSCGWRNVCSE